MRALFIATSNDWASNEVYSVMWLKVLYAITRQHPRLKYTKFNLDRNMGQKTVYRRLGNMLFNQQLHCYCMYWKKAISVIDLIGNSESLATQGFQEWFKIKRNACCISF